MQFVYPSFLFALGLIAVPIIIHIFNLVNPKKVMFSNISFLKAVELKSSQKIKLKHLLILISRVLFVIFLVFSFAQPYIASDSLINESKKPVVSIYIDNSQSMSALKDDEPLFNFAIKQIKSIVDKYPKNTRFQLLDNDFKGNSLFIHPKNRIEDYLSEIEYSTTKRTASDIYERQLSVLKDVKESDFKQIIWFSDLQKSSFNDMVNINKDTTIEHLLFKLNPSPVNNISIDTVYLISPFVSSNVENELKVILKNSGNERVENVPLSFLIGERVISQTVVNVNAKASEKVSLSFKLDNNNQNNVTIQIEDNALFFDNYHHLVISNTNQISVLSITDSTTSFFDKLYRNEPIFNLKVQNVKEIDFGSLANFNLIILEELKNIPLSLQIQLEKLDNTHILVIPHKNKDNSYLQFGSLIGLSLQFNSILNNENITFPNLENPLYSDVFTKKDGKVKMPFVTPLLAVANPKQTLLTTNLGNKLLTLGGVKKNIFVFASSFKSPSSDMLNHSFVVPLMYKLAMFSTNDNLHLSYIINNDQKSVILPTDSLKGVFTLQNNNYNITPDQFIDNKLLKFRVTTENFESGFYILKNNDLEIKTLAFNSSFGEGDLDAIDEDIIANFNDKKIENSLNATTFIDEINNGISLWKYCIYLALLFLLIEIGLIRWFKS